MCLNNAKLVEHPEDLTCYKVLLKDESNDVFRSPHFLSCQWKIGETKRVNSNEPEYYVTFGSMCIDGSAYHSFVEEKDALAYAESLGKYTGWHPLVFECVIPKGSGFAYIGNIRHNVGSEKCYASKSLKVVRMMERL